MPYRRVAYPCPLCRLAMPSQLHHGRTIRRCRQCHGVWVDRTVFRFRTSAGQRHLDGSPSQACPHCERPMNVGWMDLLQVDECPDHGIWFPRGVCKWLERWESPSPKPYTPEWAGEDDREEARDRYEFYFL